MRAAIPVNNETAGNGEGVEGRLLVLVPDGESFEYRYRRVNVRFSGPDGGPGHTHIVCDALDRGAGFDTKVFPPDDADSAHLFTLVAGHPSSDAPIRVEPLTVVGRHAMNEALANEDAGRSPEEQAHLEGWCAAAGNWAAALTEMLQHDETSVSPWIATNLFAAAIFTNMEALELPDGISRQGLARWAMARDLRHRISALDPEHPDAFPSPTGLANVMGNRYSVVPGSTVFTQMDQMAQRLPGGACPRDSQVDLVRTVFSKVTRTMPEKMSCILARRDSGLLEDVANAPGFRRLETNWSHAASRMMGDVINRVIPGYGYGVEIYEGDGIDVMTVRDGYGEYAYSWETSSRQDILDTGTARIPMVDLDEIPGPDDVIRLRESHEALVNAQFQRELAEPAPERPDPRTAPAAPRLQ